MTDWRLLPEMRPYLEQLPMEADDGPRVPHSCSTLNNLTVLSHYFQTLPAGHTLEVGLAFGASGTLLSSLHARRGQSTMHHAVDPFQVSQWGSTALRHIQSCGHAKHFHWHDQLSCISLAHLVEQKHKFVLIYIDGSHLFEHVMSDFMLCDLLLADGGVMAFDDSSCDHVAKAVKFIRSNFKDAYQEESPYAITAPDRAWVKGTAARLLNRQQLTLFRKKKPSQRAWGTPLVNF